MTTTIMIAKTTVMTTARTTVMTITKTTMMTTAKTTMMTITKTTMVTTAKITVMARAMGIATRTVTKALMVIATDDRNANYCRTKIYMYMVHIFLDYDNRGLI